MNYYTKKKRNFFRIKYPKFILCIISLCIVFNSILYFFNNNISPVILKIAEDRLKSEATNIIYETALDIYSKDFQYNEIIIIEKDNEGNITLVRADTVKLNYLSSRLILESNNKIEELKDLDIKIPIGYVSNNLVVKNIGPKVNINLEQLGNITSSYESVFESAGINQTIHKIYLNISMKLRIAIPLNSKDIEITCQFPVAETIIVGKIPTTAIDLNK